jgi:hypothetical protein
MEHAGDLQAVALVAEEDAVVLRAKPNHRRVDALKLF